MKKVRELLSSKGAEVFSVSSRTTILEAVKLMAARDVGALIVFEGERIAGIVSERDCVRKVMIDGRLSSASAVSEIMTIDIITVDEERTIEECMALVTEHRCRHLPVCDAGRVVGVVSIGDLVKEMLAEKERVIQVLASVASRDPLTGLFNRTMFSQRLQQALAQADRHRRTVAVIFIDLDGFKLINDLHGHDMGDGVLAELARRLQGSMREADTVGRLGGDEFVVLIESYSDEAQLAEVARKVLETVAQPVGLGGGLHQVTASVGIALFPLHGREAEELVRNADSAMYRAKQAGRNRFEFYSPL